jgi:F0F1-type ATP synthase membrane subunit a
MLAGHVLIFLIRQLGMLSILLYFVLIPFEVIVAFVQGYVYVMLLDSFFQER